jgi:plastocyanin
MRIDEFCVAGILAVALVLVGCGTKGISDETTTASVPAGAPVDPSTAGTIRGKVELDGTPPARRPLNMGAAEKCAQQRTTPGMTEDVVPGDNGTLQNVVVYLKGDFSKYSFPKATTPVALRQNGCVFEPHVVALMTGQPLQVSNSDPMTHNINGGATKNNKRWNDSQPAKGAATEETFAKEEVAFPVKCNVHPWMKAYIAVVATPYFQVTGQDGSFELKNVPPGTYTVVAWQETYGTNEQTITVGPSENKETTLTFKAATTSKQSRAPADLREVEAQASLTRGPGLHF